MNSIFIYLFMGTIGSQWLVDYSGYFITDALVRLGSPETLALFINSAVVLMIQWYLCYWLYRRKIYIKI
ncbi:MAG: hypothetical protein KAT15_25890 [Bacteroidales bacterium]|nr:hypothetical protein [Bacteroidales bacterium]